MGSRKERLTEIREWYATHDSHPSGTSLARWVTNQRQRHKKGLLSPEQITELEAVPGWVWRLHPTWEPRLTEIREWYATHDSHPSGTSLARWVTNQRHKKGLLSPEQITELEAVPGWVWRLHPTWESRLTEIREWYATHDSHPSGTSLGRWTAAQRSNYKHGRLSSERAAALDAVPGWVWRFNRKHAWWERCAEAAEWYSSNSHLPARSTKFGKWVDVQRTNRSSLDADQIAALEAIPGWSWPKPTPSWEQSRKAWLKRYMADGKVRAPSPEQAWSAKQKVAYKEGTIPSDRVAALEATPGWVWSGRHPRPDQTPTQR